MIYTTLEITPMNNGNMVTTYKNGRKSRQSQLVLGKYGGNNWEIKDTIEVAVQYVGDNPCIQTYLKSFFTNIGIRGVDISDMEIDDNKDYYEVICWGEHKNVHFWIKVRELA